ncbi:hypothetical protein [Streptomyces sp. NRRL B-24085]|uniref:hypothetical protein n=1 Tax=Streptomyces sp. NRRL B-24085 TaxID=1709476 RepID=UPI0006B2F57C|nr:hypothetical protein [Streptomyces sp. NRRL B-24085]
METPTSTREAIPTVHRHRGGTARPPAVIAPLPALLLPAASVAGRIAAGAEYPAVPPGLVIPLVAAALLLWRVNGWTTGLALGAGLFIGVGAILTPDTGGHLSSGDTALIASTAALTALVIAGAAARLARKAARA